MPPLSDSTLYPAVISVDGRAPLTLVYCGECILFATVENDLGLCIHAVKAPVAGTCDGCGRKCEHG